MTSLIVIGTYLLGILVGVFLTGFSPRVRRWHANGPWILAVIFWPIAWVILPFWGAYKLGEAASRWCVRLGERRLERAERRRANEEERRRESEHLRSVRAQRTEYR